MNLNGELGDNLIIYRSPKLVVDYLLLLQVSSVGRGPV